MTADRRRGGAARAALYVLALSDRPLPRGSARRRALESVAVATGVYALGQRRNAAPQPSDAELRAQHALVVALAGEVDAILPVRFGTLLDVAELRRTVRTHADEIGAALDEVRGRVQMTIRVIGRASPSHLPLGPGLSGRQYLESRRRALQPPLPPGTRRLLDSVRGFVARERKERGAGELLATLYHLVERDDIDAYRRAARRFTSAGHIVTGPWPPFAFTPRWS